ncbi:enoyl-CoA hydratase/isomerase family protein [Microbacteriaceae bacterium K1510]|nr:enoyl-CoA hydratase/isomerase family protein [Microbacteriaceae bacterium K1510]
MNGIIVQERDIIVSGYGALRRITLNRPQAMNALTLDMVVAITRLLKVWRDDPEVRVVLLDGAGTRGFCAGGDIRALYEAARSGSDFPAIFWRDEYRLDALIARYPKPVVVLMDGIVMGGGVGLAAYAAFRIVTERSAVAMPEVGIGFFPDVGASFLLARAPGNVGTYLALSGASIGAADAIYCGLADIYVPFAALADLPAALSSCQTRDDVDFSLRKLSAQTPGGHLPPARSWIDHCYAPDTVEEIFERLNQCDDSGAGEAICVLETRSPTSLKVTLRHLRDAAIFERLEECLQQDYRIALACIRNHDFLEGVRAAVIDKDRNPHWRPATVAAVTAEAVDRHFLPHGGPELTFHD